MLPRKKPLKLCDSEEKHDGELMKLALMASARTDLEKAEKRQSFGSEIR
jgi:hypothetical protein